MEQPELPFVSPSKSPHAPLPPGPFVAGLGWAAAAGADCNGPAQALPGAPGAVLLSPNTVAMWMAGGQLWSRSSRAGCLGHCLPLLRVWAGGRAGALGVHK